MPSGKELRRRIKSIRSTRQITKAMELVSAAKMRKAQLAAIASRTYAKLAWDLIQNLTPKIHPRLHKLLRRPRKIEKVGILLVTSNRGLIGGFNNSIINKALEYVSYFSYPRLDRGSRPGVDSDREMDSRFRGNDKSNVSFFTIGKKGRDSVRKKGFTIAAEFEKQDTLSGVEEFLPVARLLINDFVDGMYDKVALIYMDFISTLQQKPRIRELLPYVSTPDESLGVVGNFLDYEDSDLSRPSATFPGHGEGLGERWSGNSRFEIRDSEYFFEPSPDAVLEKLLPRLTELQIYQAYLETDAAEHSARMVAMKNASDAASDLISELNLEYNQARQAAITKEISEIVAGKLALTR